MPRLGIDGTFSNFGLQRYRSVKYLRILCIFERYTNLEILKGSFEVSSNVFAVLITGDTGDKVQTALLLGDNGTGGESTVGNELASVSIILSNISMLIL